MSIVSRHEGDDVGGRIVEVPDALGAGFGHCLVENIQRIILILRVVPSVGCHEECGSEIDLAVACVRVSEGCAVGLALPAEITAPGR